MTEMNFFFPIDMFLFSPLAPKDSLALFPPLRPQNSAHHVCSPRGGWSCPWAQPHHPVSLRPASDLESQQRLDPNRTQGLSLCFSDFPTVVLVVGAGTQLVEYLSRLAECLPNTHEAQSLLSIVKNQVCIGEVWAGGPEVQGILHEICSQPGLHSLVSKTNTSQS